MNRISILVAVSLLLISGVVEAATGRLTVTVRDGAGNELAGAQLKLIPVAGGQPRSIETDKKGRHRINFLATGNYKIEPADRDQFLKSMVFVLKDPTGVEKLREAGDAHPEAGLPAFHIGIDERAELELVLVGKEVQKTLAQNVVMAEFSGELEEGSKLFAQGDNEGVIRVVDKILGQNPALGPAYYLKGMALGRLGRLDEAEAALRTSLEQSPDQPGVAAALGTVLLQKAQGLERDGQADQARALYEEAAGRLGDDLARDPDQFAVRLNRVTALEALGPSAELEQELRSLAAAAPDDPRLPLRLAANLHESGRTAEAREVLGAAPRTDPDGAVIAYNIAVALFNDGDSEGAIEVGQWGLEFNPDMPDLHRLLGRCHLTLGRDEEAIVAFEKFLALAPEGADTQVERELLEHLTRGKNP